MMGFCFDLIWFWNYNKITTLTHSFSSFWTLPIRPFPFFLEFTASFSINCYCMHTHVCICLYILKYGLFRHRLLVCMFSGLTILYWRSPGLCPQLSSVAHSTLLSLISSCLESRVGKGSFWIEFFFLKIPYIIQCIVIIYLHSYLPPSPVSVPRPISLKHCHFIFTVINNLPSSIRGAEYGRDCVAIHCALLKMPHEHMWLSE